MTRVEEQTGHTANSFGDLTEESELYPETTNMLYERRSGISILAQSFRKQ